MLGEKLMLKLGDKDGLSDLLIDGDRLAEGDTDCEILGEILGLLLRLMLGDKLGDKDADGLML